MKPKEATNEEIALATLYDERIGIVVELMKVKVNLEIAERKYGESEIEETSKTLNIKYKKDQELMGLIQKTKDEIKRMRSQICSFHLKLQGIEMAKEALKTKTVYEICEEVNNE